MHNTVQVCSYPGVASVAARIIVFLCVDLSVFRFDVSIHVADDAVGLFDQTGCCMHCVCCCDTCGVYLYITLQG